MKITKTQLRKIVKEELKITNELVVSRKPLTEAQLVEIAPVLAGIARVAVGAGRGILSKAVPMLKKGGQKAAKWIKDNPEFLESALEIVQSVADKVPQLGDIALDKKEDLLKALEDSKMSEIIGDVLGQAAPGLENAAEEEKNESLKRKLKKYENLREGKKMKITKSKLRQLIIEEISISEPENSLPLSQDEENILDDVETVPDAWAGGDNLVDPVDWAEVDTGDKPEEDPTILVVTLESLRNIVRESLNIHKSKK